MTIQSIHKTLKIIKFLYLIQKYIIILIFVFYERIDVCFDGLMVKNLKIVLIIVFIEIYGDYVLRAYPILNQIIAVDVA